MAIIQHIAPSTFAITRVASTPQDLFPGEVFSPNANLLAPLTGVPSRHELSEDWTLPGEDFTVFTLLTDCMDGQLEQGRSYLFRDYVAETDPEQGEIVAAYVTGEIGEDGHHESFTVIREFYRDADGAIRLKARDLKTPDVCGPDSHGENSYGITIMGALHSVKPASHFVRLVLEK